MEKISRQKTARGFKASPERARAPSFGGTEQTHSAGCDAPSENLGHHGASPVPRITLRAPTTRRSQLCGRTDRLRCISHQSFRVRGYFCCVLALASGPAVSSARVRHANASASIPPHPSDRCFPRSIHRRPSSGEATARTPTPSPAPRPAPTPVRRKDPVPLPPLPLPLPPPIRMRARPST